MHAASRPQPLATVKPTAQSPPPAPGTNDLTQVTAANGTFVAAGTGGWLASSEDGRDWRPVTPDSATDLGALHFLEGRFDVMAGSGRVGFSDNLHHPQLSLSRPDGTSGWHVTARPDRFHLPPRSRWSGGWRGE